MAGNGNTTHGGEDSDMNVISCHIHHFDSEQNAWTQFKGNTLKDSWDQKNENTNKIQHKKKALKRRVENKNMGCHISLTPFLAVVSPRAATMAKY